MRTNLVSSPGDLIQRRSGEDGRMGKAKTVTDMFAAMHSLYLVGSGVCERRQTARSNHGNV
jgi:hypothetical protein